MAGQHDCRARDQLISEQLLPQVFAGQALSPGFPFHRLLRHMQHLKQQIGFVVLFMSVQLTLLEAAQLQLTLG